MFHNKQVYSKTFCGMFYTRININPLYSYSLPGYTWKAGLKFTNIKLDYIRKTAKLASGKEILLLLETKIRGGISSVMDDRYVQSTSGLEADEKTILLYIDAKILFGWAMNQPLASGKFEKIPFHPNTASLALHTEGQQSCNYTDDYNLEQLAEDFSQTPDDNEYDYFIECDLDYPAEIKEKTEISKIVSNK